MLPAALLCAATCWPLAADAADGKAPPTKSKPAATTGAEPLKFMRVVRDKQGRPLALETGTAHYVSTGRGKPYSVDLIGCIHIADKPYYDALREQFKQYDVVLFELVMPEGVSLKGLGDRKGGNPISLMQQSLPQMLDLDYQLKHIDYTAKNFVHADLSPDQMSQAMKKRGDNAVSVFLKAAVDVMGEASRQSAERARKGGDFSELQLFAALFDPNRPLALKRLLADQMDFVAGGTGLGATLDTILVKDRNQAAIKVLAREIKLGRTKIAIFYGAAHMPDFDKRLTAEFHLKRESMTWNRAWDLSAK